MLTHRSFSSILILLLSVCAGLPRGDAASAGLAKIRVGYPSPSASMYPLFVTKEAGIFEKYGFDAELIYVQGVQMVHVHTAGQLDFTSTSGIVTLQSSVNGSDSPSANGRHGSGTHGGSGAFAGGTIGRI